MTDKTEVLKDRVLDSKLALRLIGREAPNDLIVNGEEITRIGNLADVSHLRKLNISFNSIHTLEGIDQLPQLRHLLAYSCKLNNVEILSQVPKLETLMIQQNSLQKITKVFASLTKLQELRLDRNRISKIENLSSCQGLRKLDLSFNSIENLDNLTGLQKLEELKLSNNSIRSLLNLKAFPSLKELDVSHNQLKTLDIMQIPTLEVLKANHNNIVQLSFPMMKKTSSNSAVTGNSSKASKKLTDVSGASLVEIYVCGNRLKSVAGLESFADTLEVVDVSSNNISNDNDVITTFEKLTKLYEVRVHGNPVSSVSDDTSRTGGGGAVSEILSGKNGGSRSQEDVSKFVHSLANACPELRAIDGLSVNIESDTGAGMTAARKKNNTIADLKSEIDFLLPMVETLEVGEGGDSSIAMDGDDSTMKEFHTWEEGEDSAVLGPKSARTAATAEGSQQQTSRQLSGQPSTYVESDSDDEDDSDKEKVEEAAVPVEVKPDDNIIAPTLSLKDMKTEEEICAMENIFTGLLSKCKTQLAESVFLFSAATDDGEEVNKELMEVQMLLRMKEEEIASKERANEAARLMMEGAEAAGINIPRQKSRLESRLDEHREMSQKQMDEEVAKEKEKAAREAEKAAVQQLSVQAKNKVASILARQQQQQQQQPVVGGGTAAISRSVPPSRESGSGRRSGIADNDSKQQQDIDDDVPLVFSSVEEHDAHYFNLMNGKVDWASSKAGGDANNTAAQAKSNAPDPSIVDKIKHILDRKKTEGSGSNDAATSQQACADAKDQSADKPVGKSPFYDDDAFNAYVTTPTEHKMVYQQQQYDQPSSHNIGFRRPRSGNAATVEPTAALLANDNATVGGGISIDTTASASSKTAAAAKRAKNIRKSAQAAQSAVNASKSQQQPMSISAQFAASNGIGAPGNGNQLGSGLSRYGTKVEKHTVKKATSGSGMVGGGGATPQTSGSGSGATAGNFSPRNSSQNKKLSQQPAQQQSSSSKDTQSPPPPAAAAVSKISPSYLHVGNKGVFVDGGGEDLINLKISKQSMPTTFMDKLNYDDFIDRTIDDDEDESAALSGRSHSVENRKEKEEEGDHSDDDYGDQYIGTGKYSSRAPAPLLATDYNAGSGEREREIGAESHSRRRREGNRTGMPAMGGFDGFAEDDANINRRTPFQINTTDGGYELDGLNGSGRHGDVGENGVIPRSHSDPAVIKDFVEFSSRFRVEQQNRPSKGSTVVSLNTASLPFSDSAGGRASAGKRAISGGSSTALASMAAAAGTSGGGGGSAAPYSLRPDSRSGDIDDSAHTTATPRLSPRPGSAADISIVGGAKRNSSSKPTLRKFKIPEKVHAAWEDDATAASLEKEITRASGAAIAYQPPPSRSPIAKL